MSANDLNVHLEPFKDAQTYEQFYDIAQALGFSGIALEGVTIPSFKFKLDRLRIYLRKTLSPRTAARLRILAEKHQRNTDLLIIQGRTKPICLSAATIPAVHMVMLRDLQDFRVFDSQVARALAKSNKPVELCLHGLLHFTGSQRSRLMRVMATAADYMVRAKCSLVLTSGARNLFELRSPQDLVALAYLASIPEDMAKDGILKNPLRVLSGLPHAGHQEIKSEKREGGN